MTGGISTASRPGGRRAGPRSGRRTGRGAGSALDYRPDVGKIGRPLARVSRKFTRP